MACRISTTNSPLTSLKELIANTQIYTRTGETGKEKKEKKKKKKKKKGRKKRMQTRADYIMMSARERERERGRAERGAQSIVRFPWRNFTQGQTTQPLRFSQFPHAAFANNRFVSKVFSQFLSYVAAFLSGRNFLKGLLGGAHMAVLAGLCVKRCYTGPGLPYDKEGHLKLARPVFPPA